MATVRTAIAALVLCIVGPLFFSFTIRNELRARALDERGVVTLAEVTAIQLDRDTDAGERIEYRVVVGSESYNGSSRHLGRADLDIARALARIEVRYLPDDPAVSAPTRAATTRTQIVAFFVSGGLTFAGLALVLVLVSTRRKTGRWWG